jgi:DNA-binding NarL/FixJ family response regulator
MAKIALIYDTPFLADTLSVFFRERPGFELVFYSNRAELLLEDRVKALEPNLVLLVIAAENGKDILSSLPQIRAVLPDIKVIVATYLSSPNLILEAMYQGADSYSIFTKNIQDLWKAIEITLSYGAYLDPLAAPVLVNHLRSISSSKSSVNQFRMQAWQEAGKFVARELQVIQGLLNNLSYKEIAHNNNIGLNTVRHYVKSVYKKLNVNSRSKLGEALATFAETHEA